MIQFHQAWPAAIRFSLLLRSRFLVLCTLLLVLGAPTSSLHAADRLVLRDVTVLRNVHVQSFDLDGVLLAEERSTGGKLVTWDEIDSWSLETLSAEQAAAAEKMRSEVSLPLYRLNYRLKIGDWASVEEPAEKMYPLYRTRRSRTAAVVAYGTLLGRLSAQRREAAVEPWLHLYELLRERVLKLNELPGERRLRIDAPTALCWDIEPVWFNAAVAKQSLPELLAHVKEMTEPVPAGATLYTASLSLAAGEEATAQQLLAQAEWPQPKAQALRKILLLQSSLGTPDVAKRLAEVRTELPNLSPELQPFALYWIGQAELSSADENERNTAWLTLLRIPALHGERAPDVAATVLERLLASSQEDRALQLRIQRELIDKFPTSAAAKKLLQPAPQGDATR